MPRPDGLLIEGLPDQGLHAAAVQGFPGGLPEALALLAHVSAQLLDLVAGKRHQCLMYAPPPVEFLPLRERHPLVLHEPPLQCYAGCNVAYSRVSSRCDYSQASLRRL
jgi:hypothetical protein